MAHVPEDPDRYICANCQLTHAGTPIHEGPGKHSFEPPTACGGCDETEFVEISEWVRYHD